MLPKLLLMTSTWHRTVDVGKIDCMYTVTVLPLQRYYWLMK